VGQAFDLLPGRALTEPASARPMPLGTGSTTWINGDELKPIGPSTNGDLTINQWGFNHQPMGI